MECEADVKISGACIALANLRAWGRTQKKTNPGVVIARAVFVEVGSARVSERRYNPSPSRAAITFLDKNYMQF